MRNTWPQTTLAIVLRLAMVLLLTLALGSFAQGGKPNKSSPLNVTSTVHDTDSTNLVQNLLRSDDTAGQAVYATGGSVRSQIFGFWYLDLTSQTTRSVYLAFSDYVSGQMNPLPDGYYNAEVISRCFDTNNNIIDFLSVNLSDNRCSLRVDFTSGGTTYYFVMSPESQYAGTGWATVVCNSAPNGACVSWTITPTTTGTNATVAHLYIASHGGKQTLVGSYHNTYRIDVTNP